MRIYFFLINKIEEIVSKFNPRFRDGSIRLLLLAISFLTTVKYLSWEIREHLPHSDGDRAKTVCILVGLLLILTIDNKIEKNKIGTNKIFSFGFFVCFGAMIISSLIHPVEDEYLLWPILCFGVFYPLALVLSGEAGRFNDMCDKVAQGVIFVGMCFIVANLVLVPFLPMKSKWTYYGISANPNGNGMLATAFFSAALYEFLTKKRLCLASIILMSFCIAVADASGCRTALLAIAMETAMGIAYYFKACRARRKKIPVKKLIVSALVVCAIAVTSKYILFEINKLSFDAYAGQTHIESIESPKLNSTEKKIDKLSSGRVRIWKAFLAETSLLGNGTPNQPLIEGYDASIYAHNNPIEILYTSGIFAFIGYIIMGCALLIFVVACMIGKIPVSKGNLFVIIVAMGFITEAMLEIMIYPTSTLPALMMHLSMAPVAFSFNGGSK